MFVAIGIILLLILANGVFAGAEISVVSIRKTRLRQLVAAGSASARAVEKLRSTPEAFLATVQIGISVVGATAAAFGGSTLTARVVPLLRDLPLLGAHAEKIGFGLVVASVSYLSMILGELVPKSLALRSPEKYALLIGRPLLGLSWVARPVVAAMTASSNAVLRIFGDRTSFTEAKLSADELRQMVEDAAKAGSVDPETGAIASRAIQFGRLRAADVMVPRRDVCALDRRTPPEDLVERLRSAGHARLPVYDGSIDDIVGFLSVREALGQAASGGAVALEKLLRPALFVPETMPAVELLREMQRARGHVAVVVDDGGVLAGLVTMEDLVEELVGEIFSEHDAGAVLRIRDEGGSWLVDAATPLRELAREAGIHFEAREGVSTVAGLCLHLAGRIPPAGAFLEAGGGTRIEITEATPRRVRTVRLHGPAGARTV